MLLVCTYKGAGGPLQGGQGRVKSSNGTFSTYDYTRMTLLIVTSTNWVSVWPNGPSAFKTSVGKR